MKREAEMKHHAAVRAIAYKWIRIIYRLWQNRELYSEQQSLQQLIKTNSSIIQFLETREKT